MTTMTGTPYAIAVGQILMTRMEIVAGTASVSRLSVEELSAMPAADLLPHLLGGSATENPDIWMRTAHDMLTRARLRSKTVAQKLNGSAAHFGPNDPAMIGPDIVQSALDVWGPDSSRSMDEKKRCVLGVRIFLEKSLEEALLERRSPSGGSTIAPPRSSSLAMPAVGAPRAVAPAVGPLPYLAEGGLAFCRDLMAKARKAPNFDAYVRDATRDLENPFAWASMVGGDGLGKFRGANPSLIDRYRWRGREQRLMEMSLISWYHPEDRALLATLSFSLTKMILGKPAEIPPRRVRGLSGDVVDYWQRNGSRAEPEEIHYIDYQGAGIMSGNYAFGIFTELPK